MISDGKWWMYVTESATKEEYASTCFTTTSPGLSSSLCMQSSKTWHWESVSFLKRKWSRNTRSMCACSEKIQISKMTFKTFPTGGANVKQTCALTSSSQVFLCAGDGGTQAFPFSSELSMARILARDRSCLTRWFLEFHPKVEGDSEPVSSTTCGIGGCNRVPVLVNCRGAS